MNNEWDTIIGNKDNYDFHVKTFLHDNGHICISFFINNRGIVYHFLMKDKTKYNNLMNFLKIKLYPIDNTLTFNEIDTMLNDAIDELYNEYLEKYPD